MSEKKRYFTDEELRQMERSPREALEECIKAGDKEKALVAVERYAQVALGIHDLYRDWITNLMDYIYRNYGVDTIHDAMKQVVRGYFNPKFFKNMEYRQFVEATITSFFGHGSPMDIEEDEEKFTFCMKPCGGGQEQLEKGDYESGRFSFVEKSNITWNIDKFPIYCIHAAIQDLISINDIGYPLWVYTPCEDIKTGKKCTDCSCKVSIYKDPRDIPEEAYTRVGLEKPKFD